MSSFQSAGLLGDEAPHELHALRIVQIDDVDAVLAHEQRPPGERV